MCFSGVQSAEAVEGASCRKGRSVGGKRFFNQKERTRLTIFTRFGRPVVLGVVYRAIVVYTGGEEVRCAFLGCFGGL